MPTNNSEHIYFNFSYLALKLLGKGLYSNPWAALSELIANSIDASASVVYILLDLIDKNNATIEIVDNGSGMNYQDLENKYVWIGRNKRQDPNEMKKNNYMGRKGIGKLAALYLSNDYYIFSKKYDVLESWNLNIKNANDSEYPHLTKVNMESTFLRCKEMFDSFKSGTYLKLNNVDLSSLGDKRIEGLKNRFSNFFITNSLSTKIKLCVVEHIDDPLIFESLEKKIAYKNFCAIFMHNYDISNELSKEIYFDTKTEIEDIKNQKYPIAKIGNFENLEGVYTFENGSIKIKKNYSLNGWIGIHSSITQSFAQKNDDRFIRNSTYSPNKLRLYVRNKLAMDNVLDLLNNTQAFSNYIEGEISFDLLDEDDLEDIATSNRQGYNEIDGRIKLLKEILTPIIDSLIKARLKFSKIIKIQIDEYHNAEKKSRDEKIAALSISREKALAEAEKIGQQLIETQQRLETEKSLNENLVKISKIRGNEAIDVIHTLYNRTLFIKKEFDKISGMYSKISLKELNSLKKISKLNLENLYTSKAVVKSKIIISSELVECNLYSFIVDYINNVMKKIYGDRLNITYELLCKDFLITIKPIHFSSIIENLISNSYKSNATNFSLIFFEEKNYKKIIVEDDGDGLNENIEDINDIFRFGYTTTNGSGIGLFYVKNYIEESKGTISVVKGKERGIKFILSWKEDE